nr:zinc finger protein 787 isoform X2 [Camelus dromedarius]
MEAFARIAQGAEGAQREGTQTWSCGKRPGLRGRWILRTSRWPVTRTQWTSSSWMTTTSPAGPRPSCPRPSLRPRPPPAPAPAPGPLHLQRVRQELQPLVQADAAPAHAHGRAAQRLQRLRQDLFAELAPGAAPTHPHGREALRLLPSAASASDWSSNLMQHQRIHTGETPTPARLPAAAFTQRQSLAKHRRSHSGLKPFVCPRCGRGFSQPKSLARHLRLHPELSGPGVAAKVLAASVRRAKAPEEAAAADGARLSSPWATARASSVVGAPGEGSAAGRGHGGTGAKAPGPPRACPAPKPYVCVECGKGFGHGAGLLAHQRAQHGTGWGRRAVRSPPHLRGVRRGLRAGAALRRHKKVHAVGAPPSAAAADRCTTAPAGRTRTTTMRRRRAVQRVPRRRRAVGAGAGGAGPSGWRGNGAGPETRGEVDWTDGCHGPTTHLSPSAPTARPGRSAWCGGPGAGDGARSVRHLAPPRARPLGLPAPCRFSVEPELRRCVRTRDQETTKLTSERPFSLFLFPHRLGVL